MFYRNINSEISLHLSLPAHSEELFALTEANRDFLKQWLPWLDGVQKPGDTQDFIQLQLQRFAKEEALLTTIFYRNSIAGVIGYNEIDRVNGIGHIGYWLGEQYNGNGIMTLATKEIIQLGFEYFPIQKIVIRCAVDNSKSRAIPERLGFTNEGTLRRTEKVYDKYYDHIVYGLLQEEFSVKAI